MDHHRQYLLSKTCTSKNKFLNVVIDPFNERLSKRAVPHVNAVYAYANKLAFLDNIKFQDIMNHLHPKD